LELEQIQEYLRAVHPGRNDREFDSHSRQYVRR
jgi:hypothetical protein